MTSLRALPGSEVVERRALDALVDALSTLARTRPDGTGVDVTRDVLLAKKTTFGIGGPADVLVTVKSEEALVALLALCAQHAVPYFLLGGGSNLLVGDGGIRGVVVVLGGAVATLQVLEGGAAIDVGCGVTYPRLTRTALDLGWQSAIGWMGTPGQVGGALKMNAGTRHGEIGDVVVEVRGASAVGKRKFSKAEACLTYRSSAFPDDVVLTGALLRCDDRQIENAAAFDQTARELLARRHASQPKLRSAGSIFKNPPGDFAGRLIEAVGLKGYTVGAARISEVHANFVVNVGGARAADVLAIAEHARGAVREHFGVELEWEVRRVGDFSSSPAAAAAVAQIEEERT